jgi:DNA-binding YbaB/EbfC family protein
MVKVVMTCRYDVKRVAIDPSLLADDKEMLEDLVAAAVNDAVNKVAEASKNRLGGVTAGMNLPPGFKMPF